MVKKITGSHLAVIFVYIINNKIFAFNCTLFLLCLFCFIAHTPDNSFLGFVVEQHLNASDISHIDDIKRQNQSLVYGKVDNFWKVNVHYTFIVLKTSVNDSLLNNSGLFFYHQSVWIFEIIGDLCLI